MRIRARFPLCCLLVLLLTAISACASSNPATDVPSAEGAAVEDIQNKGSDTIVNLALAWAERYQTVRPEVRISVTGGGSGTGIAALANGTADIANASRQIKPEEADEMRANGIEPVEFVIARDAIAVIVHPDNPVQTLTLQQVADVYSGKITNWQEVGGDDRPIVRTSRESNSGTHVYFLETVLRGGRDDDKTLFAPETLLLPSSEGIISEVRDNPNAIGYDGLGYVTPEVKVVAITPPDGGAPVMPTIDTVNDGTYPIARDLYVYTAGEPQGELAAYLEWIYTEEAQRIVSELGFVPVAAPERTAIQ